MATKDNFRMVARKFKRELDSARLAFMTIQQDRLAVELKAIAGPGAHAKGDSFAANMQAAFLEEGLLIFPSLADVGDDGYTRIFRPGLITAILNAFRYPGPGSDEELAGMLGQMKGHYIATAGEPS